MIPKISISKIFSLNGIKQSKLFSFLRMKPQLQKDTVEFSQKIIHPPTEKTVLKYFQNRNTPVEKCLGNYVSETICHVIKKARNGDEEAIKLIEKARKIADKGEAYEHKSFEGQILGSFAFRYRKNCKTPSNELIKFNPLDYPRIFRAVGESEYKSLLNGEHIVSDFRKTGIDVTNDPKGFNARIKDNAYLVLFKDKDNFDPFLSHSFEFDKNFVPHVQSKNIETSEYVLQGGYNINDVETITTADKKIIYSAKVKV